MYVDMISFQVSDQFLAGFLVAFNQNYSSGFAFWGELLAEMPNCKCNEILTLLQISPKTGDIRDSFIVQK